MFLTSLTIKNFRAFNEITIQLDKYTALVGQNGTGKSTVLMALNILFRNSENVSTKTDFLTEEDFHNRNTAQPVEFIATFENLNDQAKEELKHYYRQGRLVIKCKAVWDPNAGGARVKQLGSRLVIGEFAPYFEMDKAGAPADDLKQFYKQLRERYTDLPAETVKAKMQNALRKYEEEHENECELKDSEDEFFGVQGTGKINPFLQWVYIPAVKDAYAEGQENKNSAFGKLLERTIRSQVNFAELFDPLKRQMEEAYKRILSEKQTVLSEVASKLESQIRMWAHPEARVDLSWSSSPKAVDMAEPVAKADIGEKNFLGDVRRMGHGLQRAFIVSVLKLLSSTKAEGEPILLLGFEEPELYQHPPQSKYLARTLELMENAQVILTTHSPYFISGKGYENVRLFKWESGTQECIAKHLTFDKLNQRLARALGESPVNQNSLIAKVHQIMQPSLNEMFFCGLAVFVEGVEDVAFISTYLELSGLMEQFRAKGGHFIVCDGKTNMSRPLSIAQELSINYFVVFDADHTVTNQKNTKDNLCLLRLCAIDETVNLSNHVNPPDKKIVIWSKTISEAIREDIGNEIWNRKHETILRDCGYGDVPGTRSKNELIIASTLESLWNDGNKSELLRNVCNKIVTIT